MKSVAQSARTKRPKRPGLSVALGALALLTLIGFANSFSNDLALDDELIIRENRLVRELRHLPALFVTDYWHGSPRHEGGEGLYRPLVLATFAIEWGLGGGNIALLHVSNTLLHLGVSVALWALGTRLGLSSWASLGMAALFAVHPLHTEAVTGLVGRAELLAALGVLLALLAWFRAGWPAARAWVAVANLAFAAALLSKEQAMVLPALILLADSVAAGRGRRVEGDGAKAIWLRLRRVAPFAAVLLAYLGVRAMVLGGSLVKQASEIPLLDNPLAHVGAGERVVTAVAVAGRYLALFFWPARLSADYSYDAIPVLGSVFGPGSLSAWGALFGWGLILTIGVLAFRRWQREKDVPAGASSRESASIFPGSRAIAFGAGLLVFTFLPVSNLLLPIGTILGERLFYLPSAGLCLVLGGAWDWAARRAERARRSQVVYRVSLAMLVLMLAASEARTVARNRDWRNSEAVFASAIEVVPRSVKVLTGHAAYLTRADRSAEAIPLLERAIAILPSHADAHLALARALEKERRFGSARQEAERAFDLWRSRFGPDDPPMADVYQTLAGLAASEAEAQSGNSAQGSDSAQSGNSAQSAGQWARADSLYRRALAIRERTFGSRHPTVAQTLNNLAVVLAANGRYDEAEPLLRQSLEIRESIYGRTHPEVAVALSRLALVLYSQGRYEEASRFFERAVAMIETGQASAGSQWTATLRAYIDLLERTGRSAEAARLRERAKLLAPSLTR